ncbi:lipid A deacylase LpxR family protein [Aquimarina sp. U1-2]|uniref:lipid A deacylase LpxR family protein n=1 Tax=Aquimarina sp. U1-2 TaxID=2823141 RepID=UPI001AECDBD6|nr:lipid A deacylase LpxR family protein [Aquimarina sp. U1-2]MBP2831078.1 lipid A deacylase LpxR family protein [Aquimarina sp. U1-2]
MKRFTKTIQLFMATLLCMFANLEIGSAQVSLHKEQSPKYVLTLGHDNDFLVFFDSTDRYYSYGLNADFKWIQPDAKFLSSWFTTRKTAIHSVSLNIEAYTPEYNERTGEAIPTEERPYAGLSYLNYSIASYYENYIITLGVDLGILGPQSQAGEIQNWFHGIIGDEKLQGWNQQLENTLAFNLLGQWIQSLYRATNFDVYGDVKVSIGAIHTNVHPMLHFRLGKLKPITQSIASNSGLINSDTEFYFDGAVGYCISAFDGTVQGNIFEDDDFFDFDAMNNFIFNASAGFGFQKNNWKLLLNYHFTTGALNSSDTHTFAAFKVGRFF